MKAFVELTGPEVQAATMVAAHSTAAQRINLLRIDAVVSAALAKE